MSEEKITGLFEFLNSFPEVAELHLTSFSELSSGVGIAVMWNACSEKKISVEGLAKPTSETDWLSRYKNLRTIDTVISSFTIEKGWRPNESVDLMGISKGDVGKLVNYIQPLVMVSLSSPIKKEVVTRMKGLSESTRKILKEILQMYQARKSDQPSELKSLQEEIERRKKHILDMESEMTELQKGNKSPKKSNPASLDIGAIKAKFDEYSSRCESLRGELSSLEEKENNVTREHWRIQKRYDNLKANSKPSMKQQTNDLKLAIEQFELALKKKQDQTELDIKISQMRETVDFIKQDIQKAKDEKRSLREKLKGEIDLSNKYAPNDMTTEPASIKTSMSIPELITTIDTMLFWLADIESGSSTKLQEVELEMKERHKELSHLAAEKARQEKLKQEGLALREDLKRVQQDTIEQQEKSNIEIEKLTDEINSSNVALTDWLSYSSAFDAWRSSPTFMSELRSKYL